MMSRNDSFGLYINYPVCVTRLFERTFLYYYYYAMFVLIFFLQTFSPTSFFSHTCLLLTSGYRFSIGEILDNVKKDRPEKKDVANKRVSRGREAGPEWGREKERERETDDWVIKATDERNEEKESEISLRYFGCG